MKFYIRSKFRQMLVFASERIAERLENWLERSGERPSKNGRSVERDATERAGATERKIGPLRSAHMLCQ